jgi:trehalose 6-phosphate phosphatase
MDLQYALKERPLGLAFDIDGTLSPIAPTPDEARLHPDARPLLEQARKYAHVAIITGRSVESGAAMVNVEGLTYIGSHGMEWCDGLPTSHPVQVEPEALAYIQAGKDLLNLVEQHLSDVPGILVERKRVGGSIHYRLSPDPQEAERRIRSLLDEPARRTGMRLGPGKYIVEVRPPIEANKGRALRRFAERLQLRGVLFAGDDRTDLDAVRELAHMRSEGVVTLAVAVQHTDTPPTLLEEADSVVQGVDGVMDLLREILMNITNQDR